LRAGRRPPRTAGRAATLYAGALRGSVTPAATSPIRATATTRGHAEAIEIVFDPAVVSYRAVLEHFFQVHDPTTYEQQGSDFGSSYRSAIFYTDEPQKEMALATIAEMEASGLWPVPVVTEINPEAVLAGGARALGLPATAAKRLQGRGSC
jgi:methionine-S-sulfoxide reductase